MGCRAFLVKGGKHNTDCSIQTLVQKVAEESHGEKEEEERKNEEEAEKERENRNIGVFFFFYTLILFISF